MPTHHLPDIHTLEQTTQPSDLLTLADAKLHLRVDHNDDDTLIQTLIKVAGSTLDNETGLCGYALNSQRWKYIFDGVTGLINEGVYLPITPSVSLYEIKYYNASNTLVTANLNDWELIANNSWALVRRINGQYLPDMYDRWDALSIEWTAGHGASEAVKHAARLMIGHWYENREAVTANQNYEMPMAASTLINLERRGWVA